MGVIAKLLSLIVFLPLVILVALADIYPYHPAKATDWGFLILLEVPFALLIEHMGGSVLEPAWIRNAPDMLRIIYAVLVLSVVIAFFALLPNILEGHLSKWGV
jgi:hypothetical protein